jgi:hypothetical protein
MVAANNLPNYQKIESADHFIVLIRKFNEKCTGERVGTTPTRAEYFIIQLTPVYICFELQMLQYFVVTN